MAGWRRTLVAGLAGLVLVVACGGGEDGDGVDATDAQPDDSSVSGSVGTEGSVSTADSAPTDVSAPSTVPGVGEIEYADGLSLAVLYKYGSSLEQGAVFDVVVDADDVPFAAVYEGGFNEEAAHNPGALHLVRCDDPACNLTTVTDRALDDLGWRLSAVLSPDGLPVIAYTQNYWDEENQRQQAWATLLACLGPTCEAAAETEFADVTSQSVAVRGDGLTYVLGAPSWAENAPAPEGLPLMICDDPTCTDGPRFSVLDVDPVPIGAQIALGDAGIPVAVMSVGADVSAISCLDAECAEVKKQVLLAASSDGDYWIDWPQLATGANGPVAVAFKREPADPRQSFVGPTLMVWERDPSTAVQIDLDEDARLGPPPGVAVGVDGRPAVAWMRLGPDAQPGGVELLLARCDDRSCTTGTTAVLARNLRYTEAVSVGVGPNGIPLVAFVDENQDPPVLTLARCNDPACAETAFEVHSWTTE